MSQQEKTVPLRTAILTVSDTRTFDTDRGGLSIQSYLTDRGHQVIDYAIVKDEKEKIQQYLHEWVCSVDAIIVTGGTGLAKRDVTIEAVRPLAEKEIPGFGELFRFLSYRDDIGARAMASRAFAAVICQSVVFCLPGSVKAIKLAMEKLILPELPHLVSEITK